MEQVAKFVDFEHYCKTCENCKDDETNDTCNECLTVPAREYSHKPINYKKKEV